MGVGRVGASVMSAFTSMSLRFFGRLLAVMNLAKRNRP